VDGGGGVEEEGRVAMEGAGSWPGGHGWWVPGLAATAGRGNRRRLYTHGKGWGGGQNYGNFGRIGLVGNPGMGQVECLGD
jgi:hypothetical protein